MNSLKNSAKRGDIPFGKVLSAYANYTKIISVCMTLSNVVVMYMSKTISACVFSAVLSIATEVSCKMYVVWVTRAVIRGQVGKEIVEGLKHVVVEPGVQGIAQLDDDTDWKARALAAEEEARAAKEEAMIARNRVRVLEELLRSTRERYGEPFDAVERGNDGQEGVSGEGSRRQKESDEKDDKDGKSWETVASMLAARWEKEMVAEKSCILFAAFVIYFFDLSDMPASDLLVVCAIFSVCEIVADTILVYVLDKYFLIPILRLPHATREEFFREQFSLSQALLSISFGLCVVSGIVNENLKIE